MKKFSYFFIISTCALFIMLGFTLSSAQTVVQTWDFENDLDNWVSGAGSATIELSTVQAHSDSQSVKMEKSNTSTEINLQNDVYKPVEGDSINFWIWISAADLNNVNGVQVFWQDGSGWAWHSKWNNGTDLVADTWNEVGVTFPALTDPLQRIGLQMTGKAGTEDSTVVWYVDDITIIRAEVPPAEFNIVVDAEKDDWYNSLAGPDDGYLQLHFYHGNNNGVAKDDADLSAKMWAAWDSTWFYFYTEVKDDTISGSGSTSYNNDGLELKVDPKPLLNRTLANNTIFPPNLTILGGANSDSLNNVPDSMKQWSRRITSDGYALELAIKWPALSIASEDVTVAVDSTFGLAINIHDNDRLVGGSRVASVQWAAVMNDNVWNTPTSLGTAKFLADHKIQFIPTNTISGVENKLPFDATPFAIVVDGQKDWVFAALETPSAQGPNNGYLRFRPWNANDNGSPVNNADLSSTVSAMWDDEWLYLFSDVTDDTVSDGGAANPWEVDNFELKVDPQPTDSTQQQPALWDTRITAPGMSPGDSLNNVADSLKKYVRRLRSGGYAFEIAVKWSAIRSSTGETVSVGVDSVFGLAINQHDNDGNGRQASEMWGAVMLDAAWNNAKYLGTVKFLPNYRLQFIPENNVTHVRNNLPYDGVAPQAVGDDPNAIPTSYSLNQNYPNPFNPSTTIQFSLPENSNIRLVLYDILGREVKVIAKGEYKPGSYKVRFDAANLASGVYFYRLETEKFVNAKKLMIMK